MPSVLDYEPIITKLLEKSEQGRLKWEKPRFSTYFECTIDEQYRFKTERSGDGYLLRMEDKDGAEIFTVTAEEQVVFKSGEEEKLFEKIRDIHELARRKALNVDEKLATVTSLLDKV